MIKIKRGLDLPISGEPRQVIADSRASRCVALIGDDYPGLKPTMEVIVGDKVYKGQVVFTDKKNPGVKFTAPGTGTVSMINRGPKRVFESLVIDLVVAGEETEIEFDVGFPASMLRQTLVKLLINSGEWVAIRTRPYNKIPAPDAVPAALFVTAIDTRPLAPSPEIIIAQHQEAFSTGISAVSKLTAGKVYICSTSVAQSTLNTDVDSAKVIWQNFSGPHPAGLVGTHIHFLSPVHSEKSVWHLGYQDVIAIGHLLLSGKIFSKRVIALGGPSIDNPRLLTTRVGASINELVAGELAMGDHRVISGSVFDGRKASAALAYLGRYHNQISVLKEGTKRELLGFIAPGANKFSLTRLFTSSIFGSDKAEITTSTGGSSRAMVPLGTYEEVMPLDILPTQLLRALITQDIEVAIELGCLELSEEDLALCTFACPGKYEYGPYLRKMLTRIEAEG